MEPSKHSRPAVEALPQARPEQGDEAGEADADAGPAARPQAFAARKYYLNESDIKRDDGDKQGGEAGGEILLSPDDSLVANAENEDADGEEFGKVAR